MKKLLLALAFCLVSSGAWAQCTGVFPAKTLCGNLSGIPAPPSAFPTSGNIFGPANTTSGQIVTWGNPSGSQLSDPATITTSQTLNVSSTTATSANFITITTSSFNSNVVNTNTINTSTITISGVTLSAFRTVLTSNTTYYIRSDGSNTICNGSTNATSAFAPNCSWSDAQFAINYLLTGVDLGGHIATIQYGEPFHNFILTSAITCSSPFTGGGQVILQGSPTWNTTGTALNGVSNNVNSVQVQGGCNLTLNQLQILSSQIGVTCFDGGSGLNYGSIDWEGYAIADIFASQGCEIQQIGGDIIDYLSTSQNHITASHHGEFRNAGQTTTFGAAATYGTGPGGAFAYADFLGIVVFTASPTINVNGQSVTGGRCFPQNNSIVEFAGLTSTFIPGSVPCPGSPNTPTATGGIWVD